VVRIGAVVKAWHGTLRDIVSDGAFAFLGFSR